MADGYSKGVMTVIAAALLMIAMQMVLRPAGAQIGTKCDGSILDPCYIRVMQ